MHDTHAMFDPLGLPQMLLAADSAFLISFYKPFLAIIPFLMWAWVVSKIYDKHAAQYFLPRRPWNMVHLGIATVALFAMLFTGLAMPGSEGGFWAGWGIAILLLVGDGFLYPMIANKDEKVPESRRITFKTFFKQDLSKGKAKAAKGPAEIKLAIKGADASGKYTKAVDVPQPETPEMELRVAAETLYSKAIKARASQIEITPGGADGAYAVKFMIDGVLHPIETLPGQTAGRMMDFFKTACGLDLADRRRKLQGSCALEEVGTGANRHVLRVTSIGAQGGMRLTMLIDPEQAVTKKLADLGLIEQQQKELKEIIDEGKGVVLVVAPRDGGRTTMLYSIIRQHDAYINNVQTVELEPQAPLEGVRVNKFDATVEGGGAGNVPAGSAGPEFSTLVRSILRRDPQVVGIAEMPDPATAKEISKADHERVRSYLSFNASDPMTAIQAWVKAVGDQRIAGEALHGVVCGKLVRKLCNNCRVAYPPAPDMLKKLGIPEGKVQQLFKKGGQVLIKNKPDVCPMCQGHGYYGQEGVFEIFKLLKEERDLIVQGNLSALRAAVRKRAVPTMQAVALRKAVDGTTSVEEVMRVTTEGGQGGATVPAQAGAAKPPAPPAPQAPTKA